MTETPAKVIAFPLAPIFGSKTSFFPIGFGGQAGEPRPGELLTISPEDLSAEIQGKVRKGKKFWVVLNFQGPLMGFRLKVKTFSVEKQPGGVLAVLKIIEVSAAAKGLIAKLAQAQRSCEGRIRYVMKDVCRRDCFFWTLCQKSVKLPEDIAQAG